MHMEIISVSRGQGVASVQSWWPVGTVHGLELVLRQYGDHCCNSIYGRSYTQTKHQWSGNIQLLKTLSNLKIIENFITNANRTTNERIKKPNEDPKSPMLPWFVSVVVWVVGLSLLSAWLLALPFPSMSSTLKILKYKRL